MNQFPVQISRPSSRLIIRRPRLDIAPRHSAGRILLLLWTRPGISSRRSSVGQHHLLAAVRAVHRRAYATLKETIYQNGILLGGFYMHLPIDAAAKINSNHRGA